MDVGIDALNASRLAEAGAAFTTALEYDPKSLNAHMNLGTLLASLGQQRKAVTHLSRALALAPGHRLVAKNAVVLLLQLGRWDLALPVLSQLLTAEPTDGEVLAQLAFLHLENGRRAEAVAFAKRATEAKPGFADAHYVLYRALYDDRAPREALEPLKRAAELDPAPWYRFLLGVLLEETGDAAASKTVLASIEPGVYAGAIDSWDYVKRKRTDATRMFSTTRDTLVLGQESARIDGSTLELGVRFGISTRWLSERAPQVHGFDSFEGLPEEWHIQPKGAYTTHGQLPVVPDNVKLHVGWFDATLPVFMAENAEPLRFANVDCDLYSSTKVALDALAPRVRPGTVIVFDEYIVNDAWREDEFKAFQEAVNEHGWKYEYLAFTLTDFQAAVRIL